MRPPSTFMNRSSSLVSVVLPDPDEPARRPVRRCPGDVPRQRARSSSSFEVPRYGRAGPRSDRSAHSAHTDSGTRPVRTRSGKSRHATQ